jgi:RNA polymerase sigma-70 factor (ECF subfamily)
MLDMKVNITCNNAIIDFAKGNSEALSIIYDCMARMIFSLAYSITSNYEDAEEVLQNTMLEIVKYAHTYKQGSNAKAWILAMARHISIDIVRKRKPSVPLDQMEISNTSSDLERLEVLDLLNILDADEKQLIILRLYAQMPYGTIAFIMKISITAAQKKYQRAVKKLKNHYL